MPALGIHAEPPAGGGVAVVIFGVTGDLAHRKLIPALYELKLGLQLPEPFYIIGFARRDWDDDKMRSALHQGVMDHSRTRPVNEDVLSQLLSKAYYIRSRFDEADGYDRLAKTLDDLQVANCVYYLATPPESYIEIIRQIGAHSLSKNENGWRRIIVEKPYGRDLNSARNLDLEVHQVFDEPQVYRIDHYLGKETVQNILVFRFGNGIFEPLWDRRSIDHVQITVAETVGVESRAGFYETAGVIRDVFQNHLLQLLTLTAMEAPVAFNADAVRDEKVKVLKALRPMKTADVLRDTVRAQYVSGFVNERRVPSYRDEPGVSPTSLTETYLGARLFVDDWRWSGVPFYIRSGKRFPRRITEIAIHFKQVPLALFGTRNFAGDAPNMLILNIQPDEGITLTFGAKAPGPIHQVEPVKMEFSYARTFGGEPPEAYERLLLDCLMGDATLFTRSDEVLAAWGFTTNILEGWATQTLRNLPVYEAGTSGPPVADEFIGKDGRAWRDVDQVPASPHEQTSDD
jgi:glucose-6-phosphate 1-dehydrogenase